MDQSPAKRRLSVESTTIPSPDDFDEIDIDLIEEQVSEVGYLDVQGFGMNGG
jgi:hypothetical protein